VRRESEGAGSWALLVYRLQPADAGRPTKVGTPACAAPFPPFLAFVCRTPATNRLRAVIALQAYDRHSAQTRRANRPDLVQEAQDEISILQNFLPAQLTETELKELVAKIITELNATGQADIGKVMKALLPMTQGRAPGNVVNQMVREMLAG